jgi:predicted DNA-binding transcriptional regulator YafY
MPLPGAGPPVDPAILTVIATAARDRQRVRFDYTSHDGTQGSRAAEPQSLVHADRRWYLLAWDPARDGWRTFRVDRIATPQITGPRFTPRDPPDGDAAAYVAVLGTEFEILDPPELAEHILALAGRLTRAVQPLIGPHLHSEPTARSQVRPLSDA